MTTTWCIILEPDKKRRNPQAKSPPFARGELSSRSLYTFAFVCSGFLCFSQAVEPTSVSWTAMPNLNLGVTSSEPGLWCQTGSFWNPQADTRCQKEPGNRVSDLRACISLQSWCQSVHISPFQFSFSELGRTVLDGV